VANCPRSDFLRHIEPACRAGIIFEDGSEAGSMVFVHALLRDALYDSLETLERKLLHVGVANAIIAEGKAAVRDSAGMISDHLRNGLPVSDARELAKFSRIAGRQCIDRFAFEDALTYFQQTLRIVDRDASTTPQKRCAARFDLAEAQIYTDDRNAARQTLLEAVDIARKADLPELIAESALRISPDFLSIEVGPIDPQLIDLLRESLERLSPRMDSLRAQVMARLSLALAWSGSVDERARYSIEAMSLARKLDDPQALGGALAARSDALHGPDRIDDRLHVNAELRRAMSRSGNRPGLLLQHIRQVSALLDSGDTHAVDIEIAACEASIREMNVPQFAWYPIAFRAMRDLMRGDLASADRRGHQFLRIGNRSLDSNVAASRACQACAILMERDDAGHAVPFAISFVDRFPDVHAWKAGLGLLRMLSNEHFDAVGLLEMFDSQSIRRMFRETAGSAGIAFLAEIAVECKDIARAALIYELIASVGQRSATLGYGMGYFGCFARYAGLLAGELGLDSESLEHLRNAVEIEKGRAALLWKLHAELDLATALARFGGHKDEATSLVRDVAAQLENTELNRAKRRYRRIARQMF
jgi:tetratricopeptide (TPR) repeat protein